MGAFRKAVRTRGLSELDLEEKEAVLGYALLLPSLAIILAIIIWPLLWNVYLSFSDVPIDPALTMEFIGVANYADTVTSDRFWAAFRRSLIYTTFSVLFATIVGLGVALLLRRRFRGQRIVRGIVIIPYVMPVIASAFVWRWMGNPIYGAGPYTLRQMGVIGPRFDPIGDPSIAIWSLIIFDTWRYYPFAFLMIYARVMGIPTEMYEAAKINGAGPIARFKDITLPELKFVIGAVVLLRMIWNFNAFTQVWLFTPAVEVLPVYVFIVAFSQWDLGLGAAISIILLIIQLIVVTIYVRWALDW